MHVLQWLVCCADVTVYEERGGRGHNQYNDSTGDTTGNNNNTATAAAATSCLCAAAACLLLSPHSSDDDDDENDDADDEAGSSSESITHSSPLCGHSRGRHHPRPPPRPRARQRVNRLSAPLVVSLIPITGGRGRINLCYNDTVMARKQCRCYINTTGDGRMKSSTERQKGLISSNWPTRLDSCAFKLTICLA